MDIGKYIIKFLIKNRFCSLPGLGSFELEKISAAIHTNEGEITPAKFQIKFSPIGSIDDTFASFIANHENVSISNTSNNIKEYCRVVKEEIAQQGKFAIPLLGFLTMQNGKIAFVQTDELDMGAAALPLPDIDANLKMNANKKLDFSYPSTQKTYKRKKLSIGKFVIPAIVILILGVGSFVAYKYISDNQKVDKPAVENAGLPIAKENVPANDTAILARNADSNINNAPPSQPIANNGSNPIYKVATFTTSTLASANAKANKWKNYGNLTEVDSLNGNYIVSILASHPLNDTTLLVDSLRLFFNPKGQVYIIK